MRLERGLSLLELLISLSLFALIGALSYPSLMTMVQSWHAISFESTPSDVYAAQRFVRQQLRKATAVYELEQSSRTRLVAFDGDRSYAKFVVPLRDIGSTERGFHTAELRYVEGESSAVRSLKFFHRVYETGVFEESFEHDGVSVIDDISDVNFEYFDPRVRRWRRDWKDRPYLPSVVKINFLDAAEQARSWVIRLMQAKPVLASYAG